MTEAAADVPIPAAEVMAAAKDITDPKAELLFIEISSCASDSCRASPGDKWVSGALLQRRLANLALSGFSSLQQKVKLQLCYRKVRNRFAPVSVRAFGNVWANRGARIARIHAAETNQAGFQTRRAALLVSSSSAAGP